MAHLLEPLEFRNPERTRLGLVRRGRAYPVSRYVTLA